MICDSFFQWGLLFGFLLAALLMSFAMLFKGDK